MTDATGWTLAAALVAVMAGIVVCTARWRVHPFLVLIGASLTFGVAGLVIAGRPVLLDAKGETGVVEGLLTIIGKGFGGTLASIGIVILFGTIIGYVLEKTGAAWVMAETILRAVGRRRAPLAMGLAGLVIGVPVFCDSGFIVLSALNRALAVDAGLPLAGMSTSLSMGLYSTHVMVPPTPGPLAAAGNLGADIGLVMLLGLAVAVPAALAGVLYAQWIVPRLVRPAAPAAKPGETPAPGTAPAGLLPSPLRAFLPILVPVVLIALGSVAALPARPLGQGWWTQTLVFAGHPVAALAVGMVLAFGCVSKWSSDILDGWVASAVRDAAVILVITAAGGSLGAVIRATGLGDFLGEALARWHLGLLLPFLLAATIKTAQGSSTVAIVTASGILAPLLGPMGWTAPAARALAVLAVGAGAMVVSHANDSYFWVVSQFSDMDVPTAYKTQTVGSLVSGLAALTAILTLSAWLL